MKTNGCRGPAESGGSCGRKIKARGLCEGHWTQERRGQALRPLRNAHGAIGPAPKVRIAGLQVSPECAAALASAGPSVYAAAQAVLESWALGERKGAGGGSGEAS